MYIPALNQFNDSAEIISFMQEFSFATIISIVNHKPEASSLPFMVSEKEGKIILTAHFAKANTQWKAIEQENQLVIFSAPHAYISPGHYEKKLNVPTWNYMAVHAYGTGKIIDDKQEVFQLLENTILQYEKDYMPQYRSLPEAYKTNMANGIVAFEIIVTDLQAKKKLSQNKTAAERTRIIETLSKSNLSNEQQIAAYMQKMQ